MCHTVYRIIAFPTGKCLAWPILLLSHVQLIHMDLKSKNVLLNARKDLAKIADVGLSRIIQSTLGGAGSTPFGVGTFEYTAPEILLGRHCNEKVDPAHQHSVSAFHHQQHGRHSRHSLHCTVSLRACL